MKMTKLLSLLLALIMAFALTACGESGEKDTYTVGICQLVQHPALDEATRGFKDALKAALGDKVVFDEQNASNDIPACATIANGFVSKNVDLIMANATPVLQTMAAATTTIPILGTSVTEYGVALDIKNFSGTVGGNISGTSDLAPLDQQAKMIKELFPDAKNVSLIYCSAEANSLYQVNTVKAELEKLGMTATLYSFADSNDLASVAQSACVNADVLYAPTDNTLATSAAILGGIVLDKKIPVVAGEEGICSKCGVASLTIDYYDLGYKTGEMAVEILTGKTKISEMPIQYAPNFTKKYNEDICREFGIEIPSGYEKIETN